MKTVNRDSVWRPSDLGNLNWWTVSIIWRSCSWLMCTGCSLYFRVTKKLGQSKSSPENRDHKDNIQFPALIECYLPGRDFQDFLWLPKFRYCIDVVAFFCELYEFHIICICMILLCSSNNLFNHSAYLLIRKRTRIDFFWCYKGCIKYLPPRANTWYTLYVFHFFHFGVPKVMNLTNVMVEALKHLIHPLYVFHFFPFWGP